MENLIKIQVPVSISYPALEGVLKKQMVGDFIPRPEEGVNTPPYAQILDVGIAGSGTAPSTIILRIRIKILRTILKRDQVDLHVLATLGYDNEAQLLFVRKFKLESGTSSGFFNTALEVLANKVAYNQIISKTRINLKEVISKELKKANGMLEEGLELKGMTLLGAVSEVRVQDITPQPNQVTLTFELQGNLEARISDLISLMPPK